MEVHLTAETEKKLKDLAARAGGQSWEQKLQRKNELRIRLTSPNLDDQTLYLKLRGTREAGL